MFQSANFAAQRHGSGCERAELGTTVNEACVEITARPDIVTARQRGRTLAAKLGFSGSEATLIAAAISEIGRNILEYAHRGVMTFGSIHEAERRGIQIVATDEGPGIADVRQVMQLGCTRGDGQRAGLPGVRWLMDEFDIVSKPGEGTTVTMKKWVVPPTRRAGA